MSDGNDTLAPSTTASAPAQPDPNRAREVEMQKLHHAVEFLNNHVPQWGSKPYTREEGWQHEPKDEIDSVPSRVRTELEDALVAAARYAQDVFRDRTK